MRAKHSFAVKVTVLSLASTALYSGAAVAHIRPAARSTLRAQPGDSVDGVWKGRVDVVTPGGHTEHSTGILWLKSRGGNLIGAIGSTDQDLKAITRARTTSSGCQFTLVARGAPVVFDLRCSGGHLKGDGVGTQVKIAVDLQPAPGIRPLYEQIFDQDARLFGAFNARDLNAVKTMFSKDLEFYHDKNGLAGYQQNMDSFRRAFAASGRVRRELETETLEVYPVKDFGAMEVGVHRFYTTEPGQPEQLTATAKFVHVWKHSNGTWQIVRVVSYDHE